MLRRSKLGLQNGGRCGQVVVNSGLTVYFLANIVKAVTYNKIREVSD
jgi:hypothetical protein